MHFPGASVCEESACNTGDLGWEDPWRRAWQPTPLFLPGESSGTEEKIQRGSLYPLLSFPPKQHLA